MSRRIKASDQSYGQLQAQILAALQEARGSNCYIVDVWDDHVVYTEWSDDSPSTTWQAPYSITDGTVTFGDRAKVEPVTTYRAVKSVGPDTIEGLAIPFGYRDTDGEYFTAQTDLCLDWFGKSGRPFLFEHGLDDDANYRVGRDTVAVAGLKTEVIGRQTDLDTREEGIWASVQLGRNRRYRKAVDQLIEEGALGYSAGAMPHLASRKSSGELIRFPFVELSGTPIPAAPVNLGVHYVKSAALIEHLTAAGSDIPAPLVAAAMKALDDFPDDTDSLLRGDAGVERLVRFVDEVGSWVAARRTWAGKSGRVLSAATRERLVSHPKSLRQLADDLDELLASADAPKDAAKAADIGALELDYQRTLARVAGVPLS